MRCSLAVGSQATFLPPCLPPSFLPAKLSLASPSPSCPGAANKQTTWPLGPSPCSCVTWKWPLPQAGPLPARCGQPGAEAPRRGSRGTPVPSSSSDSQFSQESPGESRSNFCFAVSAPETGEKGGRLPWASAPTLGVGTAIPRSPVVFFAPRFGLWRRCLQHGFWEGHLAFLSLAP